MKVKKIVPIVSLIIAIVCVAGICFFNANKELEPSENNDLLFLERYYNLELPKSKNINIIDGNRNTGAMLLELTVKKEYAEQFLKTVEPADFENSFSDDVWKRYYTEKQKEMLLELSKKENSTSFKKLISGRYVMATFQMSGVCYKKSFGDDYIIFIEFYTIETEEKLIEICGKEWYK